MTRFKLLAVLNLGVIYFVWGSTFLAVEVALHQGWPALLQSGFRFLAAGLLLYAVSRLKGETAPSRLEWLRYSKLAMLLVVLGPGLIGWSEQWLSSGMAALLAATSPFWVSILDKEEKLNVKSAFALSLGFVGLIWLLGASLSLTESGVAVGALACIISGMSWAFGSLSARANPVNRSSFHRSGSQLLIAGVVLSLFGLFTGERLDLQLITGQAWIAQAYLILFGSVLGFSSYTWAVANLASSTVATHAYINPLVAIILASIVGENPMPSQSAPAGLLILTSIVLLQLSRRSVGFHGRWKPTLHPGGRVGENRRLGSRRPKRNLPTSA